MSLPGLHFLKRATFGGVGHGSKDTGPSGGAAGCSECGMPVDRLRDPVRIEGSRIIQICKACTKAYTEGRGRKADEAQAFDTDWTSHGHGRRDSWPWHRYTAAGGLMGALMLVTWQVQPYGPARTASAGSLAHAASGAGLGAEVEGEGAQLEEVADPLDEIEDPADIEIPAELPPTLEDMLENSEEPLHEMLPTLADWVFPVQASDEPFPLKSTRQFGASREGVQRTECGAGHCGVDLDGPRGTTIVAVAWGVVTRIERRSDRRSGKYVRIEHPDYVYTSYMHLDEIAEGLELGAEVQAGDPLGTLGRTGIQHSAPHLHFSLEIPGGGRFTHIDPTPYLERAARLTAE